jgi:hypothetical protein
VTLVVAGLFSILLEGRVGRFSKPPPQFGQTFSNTFVTHSRQNVHSKVQIIASSESLGKSLLQFSQVGRNSNIFYLFGSITLYDSSTVLFFINGLNFFGSAQTWSVASYTIHENRDEQ